MLKKNKLSCMQKTHHLPQLCDARAVLVVHIDHADYW